MIAFLAGSFGALDRQIQHKGVPQLGCIPYKYGEIYPIIIGTAASWRLGNDSFLLLF